MQKAFKAKGTELLKAQKYTQAIDKYTQALNIMNERINRNQINSQKDMFDLITNIKLPCLKNISLCYMRLKQYADCVITCDLVLEIDSECDKTYYRKANALIELQQFKDADNALIQAETLNPTSSQIMNLRKKLQETKFKNNQQKQFQNNKKPQQLNFTSILINFIMYWLMLPIRWTKYTMSFFKKILIKAKQILNESSRKIQQITVNFIKKPYLQIISFCQKSIRTIIGPLNRFCVSYLKYNIPFYEYLSGQNKVNK